MRRRVLRAERRREMIGWLLIAPTVLFMVLFFIIPISAFLFRSIDNSDLTVVLPETTAVIADWSGKGLPEERIYKVLATEITALPDLRAAASLARRLNHNLVGYRSLIMTTFAQLKNHTGPGDKAALTEIDARWNDPVYWHVLKRERSSLTAFYLLASFDLEQGPDGLKRKPSDQRLFVDLLTRTLWISVVVTALCLIIGFPLAYVMASSGPRLSNWMLVLVLLPFWTSLLVRTTAWIVLLQRNGLINQLLEHVGLIEQPLTLIYNRFGVYVAMIHVLLPFLVLPLYSVMKGIGSDKVQAAAGLGAPPFTVFRRVYVPQVIPGVVAGCALVFVLALGYYITPALVGGPSDQMIAYFIAYFTADSVNWGMAASLASILLFVVIILYLALAKIVGVDRMKVR